MNDQKFVMPAKVLIVFAVSAALIVIFGAIYFFAERSISEADVKNQLTSIGKLKSDEISNWRNERLADAQVLAHSSDFRTACEEYLSNINSAKNEKLIKVRIDALSIYNQYDNMMLLDEKNDVKYAYKEYTDDLGKSALDIISNVGKKNEIVFSDFYLSEKTNTVHLDVIAPLYSGNKFIGALILSIDPNTVFYPMIMNFPFESESAENLLIKVEKNEVVYLNDLRFKKNSALRFRMPLLKENDDILAVKAGNGYTGIIDGRDYMNNNVTGCVSKIANSNWILITKMNTSEAFVHAREKSYYTLLLLFVIILIVSFSFYWFWKDRQKKAQELIEHNIQQTHYNRSLIESSIDPLLTINPEGKITDVNEATIRITGVSKELIIGSDFFSYFTEPEKAREGYLKVFNEGFVRDYPLTLKHLYGKLTPVLYNASIYKDTEGKVIGVFAAARDITDLEKVRKITVLQDWLKTGIASLNDVMRGNQNLNDFSANVISELSKYLSAKIGAFYVTTKRNGQIEYVLLGSYAYTKRKNLSSVFKKGEGLVGQVALEKQQIVLKNVPEDYIKITSGLGESLPKYICLTPVLYENEVTGIIEIGMLDELTETQMQYLSEACILISLSMAAVVVKDDLDVELKRSQELGEELQRQQEELKASNEELEEQTMLLKQSEEKLKAQQEELQVSNEELEARNDSLEIQKREIENARNDINVKAEELALASKYKSEFLANMSHELRTPLNSLLILSKMLHDNKEGNLHKDQIESAEIIYNSGNDLLHLINEILDLSKIEAGRMDIHSETVYVSELVDSMRNNFRHLAEEKGLALNINIESDIPESIKSDRKRIEQIIKNLVSNSIKFTKKGNVTLTFKKPDTGTSFINSDLVLNNCLCIEVSDTGIGISKDKQKIIFQAFQQEEGGTTREYGGTGLGLSISKELASLLGGEIKLKSEKGMGSVFTLLLPFEIKDKKEEQVKNRTYEINSKDSQSADNIADDRESISPADKVILIIEDNVNFAKILYTECGRKGFKAVIALNGEDGLLYADKYRPAAIILDIKLPGIDGYQVLESLKENSKLRHIPVHIISADDSTLEAFKKGAIGFLTKPPVKEKLDEAFNKIIDYSNRNMKNLLIAEDDKILRESIVKLIGNGDVKTTAVSSGKEVIAELENKNYDCMIMDLGLSDITGFELLKILEKKNIKIPPVIVYTGKDLSRSEEEELRNYADSIIIKGVRSEERLLDEASLFLHRVVENLPSQKKKMIINLHETDEMFKDKKLLLVDDDMRNMFALSKILSEKGFKLIKADNGIKALDALAKEPDVDLILMDIMMPEMDGYETMRRIRMQEKFFTTPIIALTAKAMRKDYAKCIEAGANDYMPKPLDIDRLCSMLRVWLYR
ncbi:MAG: response regulator [Ignavibacteriae bacterium]|nr:response regulator [Ignavibacteriota bacterium]